jgi:hypothetical protein
MSFWMDVIVSTPIWLVLFGSIFFKEVIIQEGRSKRENLKKDKNM